ncbi:Mrp/NBP35 family ATP-binding protein [Alteribacillus iranensis]|uniref:Iron-sulfur cluster carrier protein n=1 Tax=Alteribacillus iranensis TaxID=930128 RepID=A0A1I2DMB1_9BACI|nr:Mrp/NBP35 family ATP-binding protein [Alteribacillus iranensis]SFE81636.1 ATP-binding protein involved in chromosome partitioning [Alteribacillus iranensis]
MSLSEQKIRELLLQVEDPNLHRNITIRNIKVKGDYISLKVALAKTASSEQMEVQQKIVNVLKEAGADSIGLRFEELKEEELSIEDKQKLQPETPSLLSEHSQTKVISIASGKGGVGKSTVSANLAVSLSRLGYKVGLIDADIYGFSIPAIMELEKRPEIKNDKIIPPEKYGVKIMSMAFFSEDNSPVLWRGPMLGKMLNNFFSEVEWGELDYLLMDLPPGTGDVALDVHRLLPSSKEILVTTPHPNAAYVAERAGKMARKAEHEILGVIENMAYYQSIETGKREYVFGRGGGQAIADKFSVPLLGSIPLAQPGEHGESGSTSIFGKEESIGKMYDSIAGHAVKSLEMVKA